MLQRGALGCLCAVYAHALFMAEPALRQKRAEPFGQRASEHVHVHVACACTPLASQGGLRSLLRTAGNMGLVGARRQRGV